MELVQTKYQHIFSRLYEMIVNIIWYVALAIPVSIYFSTDANVLFFIKTSLFFTGGLLLYVWLVHPEPSKRVVFTSSGFEFFDYGLKHKVEWSNYKGYKITKTMPYRVIIKVHKNQDINFSYYAFSSSQRKALFSELNKHHCN